MSIAITAMVNIGWVPDGSGPEFVLSAQTLTVTLGYGPFAQSTNGIPSAVIVAGGNAPTTTNVSNAMTAVATAIAAQLNTTANNGLILGWASGNP